MGFGAVSMEKYQELTRLFDTQANPGKARQMAAYMRNQFSYYGLPTPERRKLYKPFIQADKKAGRIDWKLLELAWSNPHRELQYFVYDYLAAFQKQLHYEDVPNIERFARSKQWWDTIDFFDQIIGKIGLKDERINQLMLKWSQDENFWIRRLAIDHQLGRKELTDTNLLEKIILNNLDSTEFFINKAIGWSLRDYSKTNPNWVRSFLQKYKKRLAPLSIKEASKYL